LNQDVEHFALVSTAPQVDHVANDLRYISRARKGNVHLRAMLVGAAISASRTKGSYLKDKHHRLKARRGALRAGLAIAHKILVSAYRMLATGLPYRDLGEAYLDQISQTEPSPTSNAASNASATRSASNKGSPRMTPTSRLKLFSWQLLFFDSVRLSL
jgi:hypothetical protein